MNTIRSWSYLFAFLILSKITYSMEKDNPQEVVPSLQSKVAAAIASEIFEKEIKNIDERVIENIIQEINDKFDLTPKIAREKDKIINYQNIKNMIRQLKEYHDWMNQFQQIKITHTIKEKLKKYEDKFIHKFADLKDYDSLDNLLGIIDPETKKSILLKTYKGRAILPKLFPWKYAPIEEINKQLTQLKDFLKNIDSETRQQMLLMQDESGWTPFMYAIAGFPQLILILLDPEITDKETREKMVSYLNNYNITFPNIKHKHIRGEIVLIPKGN